MSKIVIGHSIVDGKPGKNVKLDVDLLIPSRLLIQANSGGGKSYLLRRLEELLWKIKVQTIVIDPEGEFYTLREKFGYVLVGENGETPADVRSAALLAEKFLQLKASAVCDLYEAFRSKPMERRQWVRNFLNALLDAPRSLWHPLVVIVDEAHKFCPQETPKAASQFDREIIGGCKDAMIALSTTGRKRGFCPIWATQRLAKLDKDASAEFFNRMVGMTIEDVDVDRAADLMSVSKKDMPEFRTSLRNLTPGEFYCFGRAITTERQLVKVGPVETHHPETGKAAKHAVAPPTPSEVKAFLPQLADLPKEAEEKARTEAEFKRELSDLRRKLAAAEKKQPQPVKSAPDSRAIDRAIQHLRAALQEAMKVIAKLSSFEVAPATIDRQQIEAAVKSAVDRILGLSTQASAQQQKRFEQLRREAKPILDKLQRLLDEKPVTSSTEKPFASAMPRPAVSTPAPAPIPRERTNGGESPLGPTNRRMAAILAAYYPSSLEKNLLASMCGKTPGGGWNGRLSENRAAGLLEDLPGGLVRATQECVRLYAGQWTPPSTTEEAIAVWNFKLSDKHRAMLSRLIEAHGEPVSKQDLATAAGAVLGGGFNGRISELRSTGLMLDAGRGLFKANLKALFIESPEERMAG